MRPHANISSSIQQGGPPSGKRHSRNCRITQLYNSVNSIILDELAILDCYFTIRRNCGNYRNPSNSNQRNSGYIHNSFEPDNINQALFFGSKILLIGSIMYMSFYSTLHRMQHPSTSIYRWFDRRRWGGNEARPYGLERAETGMADPDRGAGEGAADGDCTSGCGMSQWMGDEDGWVDGG